MAMHAKVDDVADAQCVDISQLRFGRLTGELFAEVGDGMKG